jgi:hypothetical protein
MPWTSFLTPQDINKKDGCPPCFAKSSEEYISTASSKQHNENVCVQNAKGTFQKLLNKDFL